MSGAGAALAGRTVLVARDVDRAGRLRLRLESLGAKVVVSPVTRTAAGDEDALDAAVGRLASFDWVVVTSVNAVAALASAAQRVGVSLAGAPGDVSRVTGPRWAAVGPATATALAGLGLAVGIEPENHSAAGLVAAFAEASEGRGQKVLLPLGDLAASALADGLRGLGYGVETVVAYRTVPAAVPDDVRQMWAAGRVDAVVVAAGSAARQLAAQLGRNERVAVVAIGEPTAAVARECGLRVDAVASAATDDAVADAVVGVLAVPGGLRFSTGSLRL